MLYFLTSNNSAELQQKSGQEFNQTFSKINLIATTPKGFAVLILCGTALSFLTFFIGFASGWAVATETKNKLAAVTVSDAPADSAGTDTKPPPLPAPTDAPLPDPVVPPSELARKPGITLALPGTKKPDALLPPAGPDDPDPCFDPTNFPPAPVGAIPPPPDAKATPPCPKAMESPPPPYQ